MSMYTKQIKWASTGYLRRFVTITFNRRYTGGLSMVVKLQTNYQTKMKKCAELKIDTDAEYKDIVNQLKIVATEVTSFFSLSLAEKPKIYKDLKKLFDDAT